jgi:diguanylate cyclase (GGDEF)-like protein
MDRPLTTPIANTTTTVSAPSKGTILIVDDTSVNLQLLNLLLSRHGYRILTAVDGNIALAAIQQELPDLILLDIMMPGMDGYEVCEQLKRQDSTKDIPIVFISALSDVFDKVKAFSLGAVDYIIKPFQTEEILARVSTHLTIRNLQKSLQEKNALLEKEIAERKRIQVELERIATTDSLTGLYNRRYFFNLGETEYAKAQRYKRPIAVILLDADHFKDINDSFSHAAGDQALVHLAFQLQRHTRAADIVARYGGEEFIILLPETTAQDAYRLAERIRDTVQNSLLEYEGKQYHYTLSMGIADNLQSEPDDRFEHILSMADKALYQAKDRGRNCTMLYHVEPV